MTSPKAAADESSLPVHGSARLVIVDDEGRLLLFRYHDEHWGEMRATDEVFLPPTIPGLLEEALSIIREAA